MGGSSTGFKEVAQRKQILPAGRSVRAFGRPIVLSLYQQDGLKPYREAFANQLPVRFTLHALDKPDLVVEQGFTVEIERAAEFVRSPPRIYQGSNENPIVHVPLDDDHLLRVAFENNNKEIVVVTVYPSRRGGYEV